MYIQYKCYIIDIIGERAKEELCMTILDIFSWLPEKELSLEEIEYIVKDIENGITHNGYSVEHQLPEGVDENIVDGMYHSTIRIGRARISESIKGVL